jgi:hypothetical protein
MATVKEKPKVKIVKTKIVYSLIKDKDLKQEREALLRDKEDYRF